MSHIIPESESSGRSTLASPQTDAYPSSHQQVSKSRKKVTTACESCKQRKVKCDGNQPCARCTAKLLTCSYNAQEDRRVRSAEKRRIKQLEEDNQYLRGVIQNLDKSDSDPLNDDQPHAVQQLEEVDVVSVTDTTNDNDNASKSKVSTRLDIEYDIKRHHVPEKQTNQLQGSLLTGNKNWILSPGATRSFGNLSFSSAVTANHFPNLDQQLQLQNFRLPDWQILPQWSTDESPLGRAYTDFLSFGKSNPTITNSDKKFDMIDATLLFRTRRPSEIVDADGWASGMLMSFVDPITQTINIAGTYMLARLMRWLLQPSPTTYAAIPDMIKPSLLQRMKVHPAFIDTIAVASLRDALLRQNRNVVDAIMVSGVDVSWPRSINEALVYVRPKGRSEEEAARDERVYISPQFAAHVGDPANWIFGRSILTEFPELANSECSISQEEIIRPKDQWL